MPAVGVRSEDGDDVVCLLIAGDISGYICIALVEER